MAGAKKNKKSEENLPAFLQWVSGLSHPLPQKDLQEMVRHLLCFRFPFIQASITPGFIQTVEAALLRLPSLFVQWMYEDRVLCELDVVNEVIAWFDPGGGPTHIENGVPVAQAKLLVHEWLFLEGQVFPSDENPVFPYGLAEILSHEVGHYLDYALSCGSYLSATPLYRRAFERDLQDIPRELLISEAERLGAIQAHGGLLATPETIRYQSEVSIFAQQPAETFAECFLYLLTGNARTPIPQFFTHSTKAVHYLLRAAISRKISRRLSQPLPVTA